MYRSSVSISPYIFYAFTPIADCWYELCARWPFLHVDLFRCARRTKMLLNGIANGWMGNPREIKESENKKKRVCVKQREIRVFG